MDETIITQGQRLGAMEVAIAKEAVKVNRCQADITILFATVQEIQKTFYKLAATFTAISVIAQALGFVWIKIL